MIRPPHRPEHPEAMRRRAHEALQLVYSFDQMRALVDNAAGPPDLNIFDFHDGVRLILTAERHKGEVLYHASVSCVSEPAITDLVVNKAEASALIRRYVARVVPESVRWAIDEALITPYVHVYFRPAGARR